MNQTYEETRYDDECEFDSLHEDRATAKNPDKQRFGPATRHSKNRRPAVDTDALLDNRVIMASDKDPRADIFRVLRTNILKQLRQNGWNSFAVTSAMPDAGKTFVSINLAIAVAMEGNQNVLLVDADLRRPSVGRYLGLQYECGLIDCLQAGVSLYDACINPGIEHLVVLPGKSAGSNSSELIASSQMTGLIKEIKSRYASGIIIFDLPPLFAADSAQLLMNHVDAALLVVEDGKNSCDELQQSMFALEQVNLLGLVLNKSRQPLPTYQYGAGYEKYEK